eukprot:m.102166 g.102166  ORF g.102166 m.102166 type:complete len:990 (-) comp13762_c0_seq2:134-3103(-)
MDDWRRPLPLGVNLQQCCKTSYNLQRLALLSFLILVTPPLQHQTGSPMQCLAQSTDGCGMDIVHALDVSGPLVSSALAGIQQSISSGIIPLDSGEALYGFETFNASASAFFFLGDVSSSAEAQSSLGNLSLATSSGTNLNEALIFGFDTMMNQANGLRNFTGNPPCRFLTMFMNSGESVRPNKTGVVSAFETYKMNNPEHVASITLKIVAFSDGVSISDGCNMLRILAVVNASLDAEITADSTLCNSYFEDEVAGINRIDAFTYAADQDGIEESLSGETYDECLCTSTATTSTYTGSTSSTSTTTSTSTTFTECSLDVVHVFDDSGSGSTLPFVYDGIKRYVGDPSLLPMGFDGAYYGFESFSVSPQAQFFLGDHFTNTDALAALNTFMPSMGNLGTNLVDALLFAYNQMFNETNGMRPPNPDGNQCRFLTLFVNGGETIRPQGVGVVGRYRQYVLENPALVDSINFRIVAYSDGVSFSTGCELLRTLAITNSSLAAQVQDQNVCEQIFSAERNGENLVDNFDFVTDSNDIDRVLPENYGGCLCSTTSTSSTTSTTSSSTTTSSTTSSTITSSTLSSSTTSSSTTTVTTSSVSTSTTSSSTGTSSSSTSSSTLTSSTLTSITTKTTKTSTYVPETICAPTQPVAAPLCELCIASDGGKAKLKSLRLRYIGTPCENRLPPLPYPVCSHPEKSSTTGADPNDDQVNILIVEGGTPTLYTDIDSGDSFVTPVEGSNLEFYIFNMGGGPLNQTIRIHTSCSVPLSLGDSVGVLQIIGFETEEGFNENTCSNEAQSPMQMDYPYYENMPGKCLVCGVDGLPKTKLVSLTLRYTGVNCETNCNSQPDDKFEVQGDPNSQNPARLVAFQKGTVIMTNEIVFVDSTLLIEAPVGGKFESFTSVAIAAPTVDISQQFIALSLVDIHTSCSQPLLVGDEFGAFEVVGFETEDGRTDAGCPVVQTTSPTPATSAPSLTGCVPLHCSKTPLCTRQRARRAL